jgi:hypothetical protein
VQERAAQWGASGIYLYRLAASGRTHTPRLVLVRLTPSEIVLAGAPAAEGEEMRLHPSLLIVLFLSTTLSAKSAISTGDSLRITYSRHGPNPAVATVAGTAVSIGEDTLVVGSVGLTDSISLHDIRRIYVHHRGLRPHGVPGGWGLHVPDYWRAISQPLEIRRVASEMLDGGLVGLVGAAAGSAFWITADPLDWLGVTASLGLWLAGCTAGVYWEGNTGGETGSFLGTAVGAVAGMLSALVLANANRGRPETIVVAPFFLLPPAVGVGSTRYIQSSKQGACRCHAENPVNAGCVLARSSNGIGPHNMAHRHPEYVLAAGGINPKM